MRRRAHPEDRIVIAPPRSMALVHDVQTREHAHPAYKLVIAVDGRVTVPELAGDCPIGAIVVGPNTRHRLRVEGAALACFFEAETRIAEGPVAVKAADAMQLLSYRYAACIDRGDIAERLGEELLSLNAGAPVRLDWRVARVAAMIAETPDVGLDTLAASVGLSRYRLSHLFRDHLRISLREHAL